MPLPAFWGHWGLGLGGGGGEVNTSTLQSNLQALSVSDSGFSDSPYRGPYTPHTPTAGSLCLIWASEYTVDS